MLGSRARVLIDVWSKKLIEYIIWRVKHDCLEYREKNLALFRTSTKKTLQGKIELQVNLRYIYERKKREN